MTIYITLIATTCLLILLSIYARHKDNHDKQTVGLALLPDNNHRHTHFYELIVFTGSRANSSTDSKVRFILSGDSNDSGVRRMHDPDRRAFRTGGVDSFIMSTEKPLSNLSYLRIWHDNSGTFNSASWFLRYVIVNDLQTKQKFYFLCERWLAVEKDDGQIERLLPLSTEVQKTQLLRLVKKEAKEKFKDGHLWLSIFLRPKQSTFSRMDRTICAFCLLYMSMVMNLAYYSVSSTPAEPGSALVIGPLTITLQQIIIGVICNLFVLPPTMLLMMLFTRSKRRFTQLQLLRRKVRESRVALYGQSGVVSEIEASKSVKR
jgi:polycystin 1L2